MLELFCEFALIFIAGVLEHAFLDAFIPLNIDFVLLILFLLFFRLKRKKKEKYSIWFFLEAGFVADLYSPSFFGIYILVFIVVGMVLQKIFKLFDEKRFLSGAIIIFIIIVTYYLTLELSFLIFEQELVRINYLELLINIFLFLVTYFIFYVFLQKKKISS